MQNPDLDASLREFRKAFDYGDVFASCACTSANRCFDVDVFEVGRRNPDRHFRITQSTCNDLVVVLAVAHEFERNGPFSRGRERQFGAGHVPIVAVWATRRWTIA